MLITKKIHQLLQCVSCYIELKPRALCDCPAEHRCMCFQEACHKEQSNELFDCVFRDGFSINYVREVLLSLVASMQMGTVLRATAREYVLMIACTETATEYFVLREFGISIWEYETL